MSIADSEVVAELVAHEVGIRYEGILVDFERVVHRVATLGREGELCNHVLYLPRRLLLLHAIIVGPSLHYLCLQH